MGPVEIRMEIGQSRRTNSMYFVENQPTGVTFVFSYNCRYNCRFCEMEAQSHPYKGHGSCQNQAVWLYQSSEYNISLICVAGPFEPTQSPSYMLTFQLIVRSIRPY